MSSEQCASCGRFAAVAGVESSHVTSEGLVRYLRCPCGRRWVDVARFHTLVGVGGTPWSAPE
ncbi:hypothetical protein [Marinitenerispora sediminis]|uniref:Uncharacterized protein n=1 Tax=Marinitenerispora sediminis TaxID=1931232 RepID=A0A368T2B9_9ACTN|nr:hypothetical protein [Marinitenerispora sediminis]RCV48173.1 hypothetical protein DEF23_25450 [Marinitenerispora sediminis]RCV50194.1 hypothetical protein DEF28_18685 [Marinitenerispora sediminis]RCV55213.1 hypothetical protein DEF24_18295 [Marinitenerispora sediminis]